MAASPAGFARTNTVVLTLSFLLAGAAVAWVFETVTPVRARAVKTVEVVVAAKDLNLGTAFTKDNIDELTTTRQVPKSELPKDYVTSKNDLIDKRLYRAAHQGESFKAGDVKGNAHVAFFQADKDIMTIAFPKLQHIHVGPGCRVDLIAIFNEGNQREVFTLLPDMQVLQVNPTSDYGRDVDGMSFAADEKQARLVALANQYNCSFELMLRHPDSPKRDFDYDATFARVKGLVKVPEPKPTPKQKPELIVAPAPRLKQIITIPKPFWGGFVMPGSRVDILAVHGEGKKREVFTLLPEMQVFAVKEQQDPTAKSGFLDVTLVSFAMSDKQALLIALATEHDCYLELVLRKPDVPTRGFDYEQTLAKLNSFAKKPEPTPALPVAPAPRVKK
ncbi:MAG: hypothetical protein K8U57_02115 [Planctomycetes bacterium]|nr:hypothetical protein [Planctomycetota bacterium]